MNCDDLRTRLSALHDGELPTDEAEDARRHLASCLTCQAELASLERLSSFARTLPSSEPAEELWGRIGAELNESSGASNAPVGRPERAWRRRGLGVAIALSLVVLLGVGIVVRELVLPVRDQQRVVSVFDRYLQEFRRSPLAAQRLLDEAFPSTPLAGTDRQARPSDVSLVARNDSLPGLTRVATHVRNLPCCECVQGLYQRADGSCVAVFEQQMPAPWDADASAREVRCGNCVCRLRQLKAPETATATWKQGKRYFTVVGVSNESELAGIVENFARLDAQP